MRIFDEAATARALPFGTLIERLHSMFSVGCHVPARHVHQVRSGTDEGTVLLMPAWNDQYLGIKTVNVYPGNSNKGLPALSSSYALFDSTNGRLLAYMDGSVITSRRTAAASALAARYLARPASRSLLVLGAGAVGSLLPLAYREVLPIEHVEIWNRSPASAERLAESLTERGIPSLAVTDLRSAAGRADVVSSATLATEPVLRGDWLAPGAHVDLIGSFTPQMREADDTVFSNASLFIDTAEALQKSGDLLGPLSTGLLSASSVIGDLAGLCRESVVGRRHASERTVFKSVGSALEDLTAAIVVYESND